jgi:hypothetical protein
MRNEALCGSCVGFVLTEGRNWNQIEHKPNDWKLKTFEKLLKTTIVTIYYIYLKLLK